MALLTNKNPATAGLTEDPTTIILAGIRVCCNKRWGRFFSAVGGDREGLRGTQYIRNKNEKGETNDAPLSRKATLAMGIPWDGAERRIWAQADPLVTGRTEDAVRVKLSHVRVGPKVLNTLLLGTFSSSTLGRRPGDISVGASLGFRGGTGGPCL